MIRLPRAALVVITLLYALVTPPFQVHDEQAHFAKAYQLSEGLLFNIARGGALGNDLPEAVDRLANRDFPAEIAGSRPVYHWRDLVHSWQEPAGDGRRFVAFSFIAAYAPVLYAPQAAGIAGARAMGLPMLGQFYAGRLVNAASGLALVLLALSLMPAGRTPMMAALALPMTTYQLGSLSNDSIIIGMSFLVIAGALHAARRGAAWPWPLAWPGVLTFLALAKGGVYLPLALTGLPVRPRRMWDLAWLALSLAVAVSCAAVWLKLNSGNFIAQTFVDRQSLQHVVAALPAEQLAYIAAHPAAYARTLAGSFVERLPVYAIDVIGRFGWFTILLPIPLYALACAVAGGSLLAPVAPGERPTAGERLYWCALAIGLAALIETALYLVSSGLGASYISGVQGRYYTPLLPLAGLAFAYPLRRASWGGRFVSVALSPAMIVLMLAGLLYDAYAFWDLPSFLGA